MDQEPPLSESEQLKADAFQRNINLELLRAKSHHKDTGYLPIPYFVHISEHDSQSKPLIPRHTKLSIIAGLKRLFHRMKQLFFGEF